MHHGLFQDSRKTQPVHFVKSAVLLAAFPSAVKWFRNSVSVPWLFLLVASCWQKTGDLNSSLCSSAWYFLGVAGELLLFVKYMRFLVARNVTYFFLSAENDLI